MFELDRLAREVREQLGAPSPSWLAAQRYDLKRTFLRGRRGSVSPWFVGTGVLLVAAVLRLAWLERRSAAASTAAQSEMVLSAAKGPRRVELPGGSALVLSAGSLVRVSLTTDVIRCVVEVGELRLEVVSQKSQRFAVVVGGLEIAADTAVFSAHRDVTGAVDVKVEQGPVRVVIPSRRLHVDLEAEDQLHDDEGGFHLGYCASCVLF